MYEVIIYGICEYERVKVLRKYMFAQTSVTPKIQCILNSNTLHFECSTHNITHRPTVKFNKNSM